MLKMTKTSAMEGLLNQLKTVLLGNQCCAGQCCARPRCTRNWLHKTRPCKKPLKLWLQTHTVVAIGKYEAKLSFSVQCIAM